MEIQLRRSQPSEVSIAVPLIYSSGPAAFEYVFQNHKYTAKDFLSYAFIHKGGEFSYDNHYSLYADDKMVGIGSFFDAARASRFPVRDGLNILKFYKLNSIRILLNGLNIEKIIRLPVDNEIALAHLAVTKELRGKGLGTQLVKLLIQKANPGSGHRFVLDVSEENPRAKELYERLGFVTNKVINSKLKNKYSMVPNHFRMEWDPQ